MQNYGSKPAGYLLPTREATDQDPPPDLIDLGKNCPAKLISYDCVGMKAYAPATFPSDI